MFRCLTESRILISSCRDLRSVSTLSLSSDLIANFFYDVSLFRWAKYTVPKHPSPMTSWSVYIVLISSFDIPGILSNIVSCITSPFSSSIWVLVTFVIFVFQTWVLAVFFDIILLILFMFLLLYSYVYVKLTLSNSPDWRMYMHKLFYTLFPICSKSYLDYYWWLMRLIYLLK